MSKSRILLLMAVLLPLILVPAYIIWRDARAFGEFTGYFEQVSAVLDEGAARNEPEKDANYRQGVENLNNEIAARLEKVYESFGAKGDPNINTAIVLTRDLCDELFRLRSDFAIAVEPFLSERMRDRKTVKDKESYEWRSSVLDGVDAYLSGHHSRVEQILEQFRQAVAGSSLPEEYKKYVWQGWSRDLNDRLKKLGPEVEHFESEITDNRRLFDYLYEYSDVYYVSEEGRIVISNNRHLKEYQAIAKSVGQEWW